jgi:hypothetical protein
MTSTNAGLLARVRMAIERLDGLTSGQDRKEKCARAKKRAAQMDAALFRLAAAYVGAKELLTKAKAPIALPTLELPQLGKLTPLEWFDSGVALDYVEKLQKSADALREAVEEAWAGLREDLNPSLLAPQMVDLLRDASDELDAACDELAEAVEDWESLPPVFPSPGDVARAKAAKAKIDAAWKSLRNSGATEDRIAFLERVGHGRVPLTSLDDDLLSWLRSTGLASRLVIKSI